MNQGLSIKFANFNPILDGTELLTGMAISATSVECNHPCKPIGTLMGLPIYENTDLEQRIANLHKAIGIETEEDGV